METTNFKDFKSLFNDAVYHGCIDGLEYPTPKEQKNFYVHKFVQNELNFRIWLCKTKEVEPCYYENDSAPYICNYKTYLTREYFGEFLKWYDKEVEEAKHKAESNYEAGRRMYGKVDDEADTGNNGKVRLKRTEYLDLEICEFIEHVYKHAMTDFEIRIWIKNSCANNPKNMQILYNEVWNAIDDGGADWGRIEFKKEQCLYFMDELAPNISYLEDFLLVIEDMANEFGVVLRHEIDTENDNPPPKANTHKQYAFDISKVIIIYEFCIDTDVINNPISEIDFINAATNADFKYIYNNAKNIKSSNRFKYIISVLKGYFPKEWYSKAAHSIGTETNKLTGKNIDKEWKKRADALKSKQTH